MCELGDKVNKNITRDMVETIVKGVNPNWKVETYKVKPGTNLGDNFMSIMYAVEVNVSSTEGDKVKDTLSVMVKTMPKHPARIKIINDGKRFIKEIKMYKEVFPAMIEFQKSSRISPSEIFSPWPQFYVPHNSESGSDDYVALQDLRNLGYTMACRREGLGLEDSKLVMRYLGKFHAISYAKFQGNFHRIRATYPYLEETYFLAPEITPEETKSWLRETYKREAKLLRDRNPSSSSHADALEGLYSETFWADMHRLTTFWTEVAVICHCDCWTNNILFKRGATAQGQEAIDLKFLDFQLCVVGSRCLDLGYFMYTSPQINILNENEQELLAEYFEAFKTFATSLGYFDPKLTLEQLLEEYENYRLYGVSVGCDLAPIISAKPGDIPDLETMPVESETVTAEDIKNIWFAYMEKEELTYEKLLNLAQNHIPKIRK